MQTKMFSFGLFAVSAFLWHGVSGADSVSVSVMEGDSVTLHTDVKTNLQEKIKWYFNDTCIARINGDLSDICTDVQCNEDTERFSDRLKLDHQTGSLTIRNINTTDSGVYTLMIISGNNNETIFKVTVIGVPAAELCEVKERDNVTLDPGVIKNPVDLMMWSFHDTCIAQITGDQSKICTDDQVNYSNERFRGRLEVNQTGFLTIRNIRTTDSGLYHLQINSSRFSITRSFRVTVSGCVPFVIVGENFRTHNF
uniref:Immunoglobulin domain-containing protein n=1 Tax=Cyprinus carpio TaxID=7962 RepID=A0A8C1M740_CYPCA